MSNIYQNDIHFNSHNNVRFNNVPDNETNSALRSTENNELLLPIHRPSTVYGHKAAISCFNKFATEINRSKIEDMTSEQCSEDGIVHAIDKFWYWTMNQIKYNTAKKRNVMFYMCDTILQYLSAIVDFLFEKYKLKHLSKQVRNDDDSWYRNLRVKVLSGFAARCRGVGYDNNGLSYSSGRENLEGLAKVYLQQNDSSGYRNRFMLVMQFLGVGRTSEVRYFRYDNCIWDYDNNTLEMQWVEEKNNKQYAMPMGTIMLIFLIVWVVISFLLRVYLLFLMYLMFSLI